MTTYANITKNYRGFKRLLGEQAPKAQILHFLNAIVSQYNLPKIKQIIDLDDIPEPLFILMLGLQDIILIHAQTEQDEEIVIQLDLWHLYYGKSFCFLKTTDKYNFWIKQKNRDFWDKSIIHIGFCVGFTIDDNLMNYQKLPNQNGFGDYHLITVNLPFYQASANNDFKQWLLLFTAAHTFDAIPKSITSPIIRQAFENIKLSTFDDFDLKWYLEYDNKLEERKRYLMEDGNIQLEKAYLKQTAKQPKFSIILLQKAFGIYPKQKVTAAMIDISMVDNQSRLAFDLFRFWTKKVQTKFPNRNIVIKDETPLLENFKTALINSIISLFKQDSFILHDFDMEYAKGFITGYVCSQLSTAWEFEYLTKNDTTYKRFQALQSVLGFFDLHETHEITIDATYYEILEKNTNLDNINPIIDTKKLNDIPENANGQVRHVLTDLRDNLLQQLIKQKNQDFDITEVFELEDEVWEKLIGQHKALFF